MAESCWLLSSVVFENGVWKNPEPRNCRNDFMKLLSIYCYNSVTSISLKTEHKKLTSWASFLRLFSQNFHSVNRQRKKKGKRRNPQKLRTDMQTDPQESWSKDRTCMHHRIRKQRKFVFLFLLLLVLLSFLLFFIIFCWYFWPQQNWFLYQKKWFRIWKQTRSNPGLENQMTDE